MITYLTQVCQVYKTVVSVIEGVPTNEDEAVFNRELKCRYDPRRKSSFDMVTSEVRSEIELVTFFVEYPHQDDYLGSDTRIMNDMYISFDDRKYRIKYINPMSPFSGGLNEGHHLEVICYRGSNL